MGREETALVECPFHLGTITEHLIKVALLLYIHTTLLPGRQAKRTSEIRSANWERDTKPNAPLHSLLLVHWHTREQMYLWFLHLTVAAAVDEF